MTKFIGRIVAVLIGMLVFLLAMQLLLTRDAVLKPQFTLRVTQTAAGGQARHWSFLVGPYWDTTIDERTASVQDTVARLQSARGTLSLTALGADGQTAWTATRDAAGRFSLDGRAVSLAELEQRLTLAATPPKDFHPTTEVTIQQVLEANIPMPTRSKVSFPEFSYHQAFPEANDAPEIVIRKFDEAPMLKYIEDPNIAQPLAADVERLKRVKDPAEREGLAEHLGADLEQFKHIHDPNVRVALAEQWVSDWSQWSKFYPKDLPRVQQRLPRNPAVVVGPDGIGQYGGVWRRCTSQIWDFTRKVCYESLTRHDPSGRLQPCLAYKWDVSPDNRVFTFYLRKGHRWSDGVPYTTADILWICNDVVGSASLTDPPDWMMASDGSMMLYEDDVADWSALARRICSEANSPTPSVGRQVMALADERLRTNLRRAASQPVDEDTAILMAADFNELFRKPDFYTPQAFASVDLDAEQRDLMRIGPSRLNTDQMDHLLLTMERASLLNRFQDDPAKLRIPQDLRLQKDPSALKDIDLNRMNLLLFRGAYRGLVAPPLKRRVQVQAVPDANGDDSHIIRFTFPKPNSIFLEQTTTFMFYRILAGAKHTSAPLHPYGLKVLAPTDFLRWNDFWTRVAAEAKSPQPSPGRRLWERLEEATRQKVLAGPPPKNSGEGDWEYDHRIEPYKQQIIDGLNATLSKAGLYDPAAWKGFDIDAYNREVDEGQGFAKLSRDQAALEEYRDVLVLEDLLRRLKTESPDSLRPEDTLKLNVMMLRWAYSRDKDPLIARTREKGLNEQARHHPRRYDSWLGLAGDRGNYHPLYNPHEPVLGAWRIVDEKEAVDMLAVRNPYYYRVDAQGSQLPYIDAVRTSIARESQVRLLKQRSGNVDFQCREIIFENYTPLKQAEKTGDYQVFLWAHDYCGEVTFYPIQAHKDPMYRELEEDPNFRYALSLALNRQEIIDIAYGGLGRPAQFSIPAGSAYYSQAMANAYVQYDPNRANQLLDAMGLDKRRADGTRLLWDGRPLLLDVNVVSGGEEPLSVVTLACLYWQHIGINAQMKLRTNAMMYRLETLGESDLRVAKEGGNYFGPMPPGEYYPSHPAEAVQWSQWASFMRTGGRSGWPAPERIKDLERIWNKMVRARNEKEKMAAWKVITDRFAKDLPVIAIMTAPGKVVLCKNNFKNVPRLSMAGWIAHEPGNCCPECFFFDHNYVKKN